jgi:hypothetical protein
MTVPDPGHADRKGGDRDSTRRAARSDRSPWNWLLLLPLLATLYPPLYNRLEPLLFDIPFFYWYQLLAIGVSVVVTVVVYRMTRS